MPCHNQLIIVQQQKCYLWPDLVVKIPQWFLVDVIIPGHEEVVSQSVECLPINLLACATIAGISGVVPDRLFRVGFLRALQFPPTAIRQMVKGL